MFSMFQSEAVFWAFLYICFLFPNYLHLHYFPVMASDCSVVKINWMNLIKGIVNICKLIKVKTY